MVNERLEPTNSPDYSRFAPPTHPKPPTVSDYSSIPTEPVAANPQSDAASNSIPQEQAASTAESLGIPVLTEPPARQQEPVPTEPPTKATYSWQQRESSESQNAQAPRSGAQQGLSAFQAPATPTELKEKPQATQESPTRRALGGAAVKWIRTGVAAVLALITVIAAGTAAVTQGVWQTYVDQKSFVKIANAAYKDPAVLKTVRQSIMAAIWEQYPPEKLQMLLSEQMYSTNAMDELPPEFEDYIWQYNSAEQIKELIDSWLPTYIDERLLEENSDRSWLRANVAAHTDLIDRFEGRSDKKMHIVQFDMASFRDAWTKEPSGVRAIDDLIKELDLKVSFTDPQTLKDATAIYNTGDNVRLWASVLAAVALIVGLVCARKRLVFLAAVGVGFVMLRLLAGPINNALGKAFSFSTDTSIGGQVLSHGDPLRVQNVTEMLTLLGGVGLLLLAVAALAVGVSKMRGKAKAKRVQPLQP